MILKPEALWQEWRRGDDGGILKSLQARPNDKVIWGIIRIRHFKIDFWNISMCQVLCGGDHVFLFFMIIIMFLFFLSFGCTYVQVHTYLLTKLVLTTQTSPQAIPGILAQRFSLVLRCLIYVNCNMCGQINEYKIDIQRAKKTRWQKNYIWKTKKIK